MGLAVNEKTVRRAKWGRLEELPADRCVLQYVAVLIFKMINPWYLDLPENAKQGLS